MAAGFGNPAMLTDLYELTMAAVYHQRHMVESATFSLFVRDPPPDRGFLVCAGLEAVLGYLEAFRFETEDLDFLESQGLFSAEFLHALSRVRFTGDVVAMTEGSLFFPDEPILEVSAPILEAQLVETYLINAVNLEVAVATKAARCVHAAGGRGLVDFSLRRTHGRDAGLKVARSSWLAGFAGTSNVLAGQRYGIPIVGTMAHSFITSFEDEIAAFRAFAESFPGNTVLLIDTYDTLEGGRKAVVVGREMAARGEQLRGVRLDSGDMAELSRGVRRILDEGNLKDTLIFASGGFDEHKIAQVVAAGCAIDSFGVGTKMGVSADAPYNDLAYKLVQYQDRPILKLSSGKQSLTGEKQVFRLRDGGRLREDVIGLRGETHPGEPLLVPVMALGRRLGQPESLGEIRDRFATEFAALANVHKALRNPARYPVRLSPKLTRLQQETVRNTRIRELGES
ncbi:MAG: nicotinate phosphoribosyltransferase [Deferrisomatales bacterium]|nr:nicotinate phosphoribosyltransferase [Deferrisomatales bacterium]